MARFAVVAPPLPGHFNPLLALSERLVARGHRVTFVGQADAAALVRAPGIGFEPVGLSSHPPGSLAERTERMARLNGPIGRGRLIRDVASLTDMLCRELPGALRRIGAEAILADQMEAAGGLVADHLRLPFASIATALPIDREPGVPPPYVGWAYDASGWGLRRNRGGWRVTDRLMRPVSRVIESHSRAFGLGRRSRAEDCLSHRLQLAQCVAGLDFPRRALGPEFHYLGPFRSAEAEPFDWGEDDGRPFAFCSLGTLQGSRAALFRRIAGACDRLGLRLVVAHGGRLSEAETRSLPGDPIVRDFVPQRAVLARTAVAICHGGFNTVLDALGGGVPILALPLAFEQPATAARLERSGAGLVLPRWAGERRIRLSLAALLDKPGHRNAAERLRAEIARSGGANRAADLAETLIRPAAAHARPAAATTAGAGRGDARDDSRSGSS